MFSFEPVPGMVIECVSGELWVTQAGDGRDVVLHAGQVHLPNRRGRVVVQGMSASRVRVTG